ncbi:MAG: ATP-grasp domain-containing protein, partial [Pseudorhodoplanes sp.]
MTQTRATILVTGAGGAAIPEIIRRLQLAGFRVAAMDMNPAAIGLLLADVAAVAPAGGSSDFLPFVRAFCTRHDVKAMVPLVDEELLAASDLGRDGIPVIGPSHLFIEACLDKFRLVRTLAEVGIPVPITAPASDGPGKVSYPCVLKPCTGRGSRGVEIVVDENGFRAALARSTYPPEALIQQEYIEGTEYTVSVAVTNDGRVLAVVPKEIVVKKGITWVAVSRRNPAIESLCLEVAEKLHPKGPFNVQLRADSRGRPWIFEINPRFSTTCTLTAAAGLDEISELVSIAIGQKKASPSYPWKEGVTLVRSIRDEFCDEQSYR